MIFDWKFSPLTRMGVLLRVVLLNAKLSLSNDYRILMKTSIHREGHLCFLVRFSALQNERVPLVRVVLVHTGRPVAFMTWCGGGDGISTVIVALSIQRASQRRLEPCPF